MSFIDSDDHIYINKNKLKYADQCFKKYHFSEYTCISCMFVYSCMHVNEKYVTRFQYMYMIV